MQADDLLNKAKAGDKQALISWSQTYKPLIARLAYQAGIPKEKIRKFQLEVINVFSNRIETIDSHNAENKIIGSAVQLMKKGQTDANENSSDPSLKFEEDEETHKAIQQLPLPERLALILFQFHGKNTQDIGAIVGNSEASVETTIETAMDELRKNLSVATAGDVQKRLDLLAKSYSRVVFPEEEEISPEEMTAAEEPVEERGKTEKAPVNKKTFATLAGASLFLSAVIGASFLFNDQPAETQQTAAEEENPTTVTKGMVKNWEAEYEEIRASAPESLGLSAETFEQLEYVRKADALKERIFSRQNVKQLKDDPQRMQEQVDVLMLNIHTPKGMLDSVGDYKLLSSETSKFLEIYTEKTEQLMVIADGLLEEYKEELSTAEVNGQLSPEKLTYDRENYPDEIKNLTAALSEYTFQYTVHPNEDRFRTIRDTNKFYEIHPFNADMLSMQYLDILRNTPHFDETGMLWPVEQLPYSIIMMATFMSDPMADPVLKGKVEPQLLTAFHALLKGDEHTDIFDSKGIVKEEFQIAWESLLQHNSNPVTFMMLPILEEFGESGWKESAHYDQLAYPDILYAIDLESNGELAEKLPNGNLEIESATLQMGDYDYSDVKSLYKKFSSSHDLSILSGVQPMEIVKLYHYANKVEDIETMWHLTADDELKPSLEEFTSKWRKRPEITETLRHIIIDKGNMHRQGRKISLIAFAEKLEYDNGYHFSQDKILVTERDEIWLMQHQMDEFYSRDDNFESYDSNVQNFYKNMVESGDLKSAQLASPAEIAGVFLLALEKENLQTMRLLVNESDKTIDDEEFKLRWFGDLFPAYSKMDAISLNIDTFNMDIHMIRGHANIIMDAGSMENIHSISVEKTEESWMISDMFGY